MKYCTKCGTLMQDDDNFCPSCGFATTITTTNQTQISNRCDTIFKSTPPKPKCKKFKFIIPIIFGILIIFGFIIFSIFSSKSTSEPTLKYCEELLGIPTENILSNDEFAITSFFDITTAKAKTPDVFNVKGEISIFILEDDEIVNIVTWQSKDNVKLTESEIEYFVERMIKLYGKPESESEDKYMWHNKKFGLSLSTEDKEIYLMFVDND